MVGKKIKACNNSGKTLVSKRTKEEANGLSAQQIEPPAQVGNSCELGKQNSETKECEDIIQILKVKEEGEEEKEKEREEEDDEEEKEEEEQQKEEEQKEEEEEEEDEEEEEEEEEEQ